METTKYQKCKNSLGFKEYHIQNVDLMNAYLASGDKLLSRVKQESFYVEQIDIVAETARTFSLYENVKEIELFDNKNAMNKARGYYTAYLKPLFPNTDIPKSRYSCEGGLFWYNENTQDKEWDNVYMYDKNSAYLSILKTGEYPDIEAGDLGLGRVTKDQVGFELAGETVILKKEGEFAQIRFPKGKSERLTKFANDIYAKLGLLKADPEKHIEALELKSAIVSAIGIVRNHNIWLYAYIVSSCRYIMESLIDENTLVCNTDSIISIGPRKDLNIGKKLGQFKVEYERVKCYHHKSNYKIYDDNETYLLKYKGKNKAAQTEDILEDSGAQHEAKYIYVQGTLGDFIYGKKQ